MKLTTTLLIAILFSTSLFAQQESAEEGTAQNSIDAQFEKLLKESNNYQQYKVIEKKDINALKANTKKRIDGLESEIKTLNETIAAQKVEIEKINDNLSGTQNTLEKTKQEKDSMVFMGAQMSKSGYQALVWGIAGLLLAGLLLFIYKFKNSNAVTKESRHKLDELEIEFDEYRKKALEKEQKLGRQLQDERNKLLKATKS